MELEANKGVMEKWMFKYDEPFIRKPLTFHELLKNFGFSTLYVS
jgi:dynein heavy chain